MENSRSKDLNVEELGLLWQQYFTQSNTWMSNRIVDILTARMMKKNSKLLEDGTVITDIPDSNCTHKS